MHDHRLNGIYFITDAFLSEKHNRTIFDDVRSALAAGVTVIQYREKKKPYPERLREALTIKGILEGHSTLFIVNDDVHLAKEVDADGVHVGQKDASLHNAREVLGPHKIVGVSVSTYDQALTAARDGATYLGAGPVFPTTTKADSDPVIGLDGLEQIVRGVPIPIVAIGGIKYSNFGAVMATGVIGAAMISALLDTTDVTSAIVAYMRRLPSHGHSFRAGTA